VDHTPRWGHSEQEHQRARHDTALVTPARQTGFVTGALAGAGEVACAVGLLRQRIDGAVGW
jgi:hypothetical protein